MKPITDERLKTLLVELHRLIDSESTSAVTALAGDGHDEIEIAYPPGGKLSTDEQAALRGLDISQAAQSGLRKVIADVTSSVLFGLFCVMDAVGDPEDHECDVWLGATLAEPDEDDCRMLHDEFFDSYWSYVEKL